MIELAGGVTLNFIFPAPLALTYAYYSELTTVLRFLPHIEIVKEYSDHEFRMLYTSREFGGYQMRIYCDMQAQLEGGRRMLRILPAESLPPIEPSAGVNSSTGRGYFSSRGLFFEMGDETRIEYEFELRSRLPRPLGMRLMPSQMVNRIARNVAGARMREIAQGFIERSLAEFPQWREHYEERRRHAPLKRRESEG